MRVLAFILLYAREVRAWCERLDLLVAFVLAVVRPQVSGRYFLMEVAWLFLLMLACGSRVGADGSDHRYKEGDHVPLYANKVGPFHNPR